jgi:zinc transporter 1/2/3
LFNSTYPAFSFAFALLAALFSHMTEFLLFNFISGGGSAERQHPEKQWCDNPMDEVANAANEVGRYGVDGDHSVVKHQVCDPIAEEEERLLRTKQLTEALLAEFSLSVHSVFVGVALGVSEGSTLVALLIALVFHQLLEGVALGCRLADSVIGVRTVVLFGVVFSVSSSVGVMIGIGVYGSLNTDGETFSLFQGIFDGISGGLLLYSGFQLLLVDFHQDLLKHCQGMFRRLMILGMFSALWLSAFAMSLIGAWV